MARVEPDQDTDAPALQLSGITAGYGQATVLRAVDLTVPAGKVVALLGPNGAGKSTLLSVAAGSLRAFSGSVQVTGIDVTRLSSYKRARVGVCLVPEGRGIFRSLTVAENLRLQVPRGAPRDRVDRAIEAFPILRDRRSQIAGSLSGGQQQMLAIARSYVSNPKVVLLDEVSMGLAPTTIDAIFESLDMLASAGTAMLLVEQYVNRALAMADSVYLLIRGSVAYSGPAANLTQEEIVRRYFSVDSEADPSGITGEEDDEVKYAPG